MALCKDSWMSSAIFMMKGLKRQSLAVRGYMKRNSLTWSQQRFKGDMGECHVGLTPKKPLMDNIIADTYTPGDQQLYDF